MAIFESCLLWHMKNHAVVDKTAETQVFGGLTNPPKAYIIVEDNPLLIAWDE